MQCYAALHYAVQRYPVIRHDMRCYCISNDMVYHGMSCYAMLRCSIISYVLRCNTTLLRNRILCGVVIRNAVAQYALQSLEGSPLKMVCLFLKGLLWGVLKVQVSGRGAVVLVRPDPPYRKTFAKDFCSEHASL